MAVDEYNDEMTEGYFMSTVCPAAHGMGASAIFKTRELDAWGVLCGG